MTEEPLLGAFECRTRGRFRLTVQGAAIAGDVGGLHRGVEMVMDDGEGAGVRIVNAGLRGRKLLLDQFVFNTVIGERPGRVEAEGAQVAGKHLHGRDTAILYGLHELGAIGEGKIVTAPQAEPLGIGEIVDGCRARGRDVDNASIWQRVLEPEPGTALL